MNAFSGKGVLAAVCLLMGFNAVAQVTINPTSRSFTKDGGGGSILTSGSGSWTATTAASWINITPRLSGVAGDSCIYVVDANLSADSRSGAILLAGQTHTVNQSGYSATLSPTSTTVPYTGGSGTVSVSTDVGISWTATANTNWVTVTPSSGFSAGSVSWTVAPYSGVTPRTTSLTIAGKTFSITQNGTDVNITPGQVEKIYTSDIIQVTVAALWNTSWSVTPGASWISVVDAGSGAGDSTVTLAIGTNPSYQYRTGTVQIGSKTFTITQQGTPYPILDILPKEATAEPVGAYGNVAVLATPDAPWTAQSLDPWLIISSGASGAGNGNIQYVVSSNPNLEERTGRIRVYPPVYEARADLSLQLFAHIYNGSQDLSGWNRDLSGSLTNRFSGTNPLTLTGQNFYRDNDAFSLAFWFNIGSPNTVNRLVGVERAASSYSAVYVDAQNRLVVGCGAETLVTSMTIETNHEYQVVVSADTNRNINVYAGIRGQSITNVGSKTFAVAPFPQSYIAPVSIRVGAANLPSDGNLTDAALNDFRVYGRALSAYEAEKLFEVAGTVKPYGDFSQNGDAANVRVEYNFQGQALVAGGTHPPSAFTPTYHQFHGLINSIGQFVEQVVYTLNLGRYVEAIQSNGDGATYYSNTYSLYWRYEFVYADGTTASTSMNEKKGDGAITVTNANPFPSKLVNSIRVYARKQDIGSYELNWSKVLFVAGELREAIKWAPEKDRFSLDSRALKGTAQSSVVLQNQQSSFSSDSATYNFWTRFDVIPVSGATNIFIRSAGGFFSPKFSCTLLPDGQLRFSLDGVNRDYNANIQTGRWHMVTVAGQYGGSTKFYVDGEEVGNTPAFSSYRFGKNTNEQFFVIGGWDGAIDYAGFYDGQLSSTQIQALYEKQKPKEVYHTVTQGVVVPSLSPSNSTVAASGGTVSASLTLAQNVNWTATTTNSWLQITSADSGAGSATVDVLAESNPTVYERQGSVTIAGKTFAVTQAGLNSTVTSPDTVFTTDGGSVWVDVSTEGNGQWQSVSQVPWLTVAIGQSGSGAGSVFIVADPYTQTSSSRIGSVVIAGHTVYFTQRGFDLSVSPQVAQIGSNSGAGEFGVAAPIGAIWEAIATHPWITITGGTTGQGNGTIRYSVAANTTGESRTGKIIVSGKEYTVTQLASLLLTAYTDGGGTVSGSGSYQTLANATVSATPSAGYMFSHWTGDAVGSANPLVVSMDSSKTIKAHFIAEDLADTIALNSRSRLGLYTTDEMHGLALGNPVLERNPTTGKMSLLVGVEQKASLTGGSWSNVLIQSADVFIQGGKVRVDIIPGGNAAFYRLQGGTGE